MVALKAGYNRKTECARTLDGMTTGTKIGTQRVQVPTNLNNFQFVKDFRSVAFPLSSIASQFVSVLNGTID